MGGGGEGCKRKSATWKDNHPSHIARKEKGTGPTLSALRPSTGCTSELPNRGPRALLCRHTRTSPPPPLVSWHTAGFPGLAFCLVAERRFTVYAASPSDTAAPRLHSSTSQFPSLLPISKKKLENLNSGSVPLKCTQVSHKKTRAGRLSPKEGAQARLLAHQVPPLPGTWQSRHEGVTLWWQPLQEAEPLQEDPALRAHQLPSAIPPAEPSTPQWLLGKCAQDPRLAHWSHLKHKMSPGGEGTCFSLSLFFVFVFPQWACETKFHGSRGSVYSITSCQQGTQIRGAQNATAR